MLEPLLKRAHSNTLVPSQRKVVVGRDKKEKRGESNPYNKIQASTKHRKVTSHPVVFPPPVRSTENIVGNDHNDDERIHANYEFQTPFDIFTSPSKGIQISQATISPVGNAIEEGTKDSTIKKLRQENSDLFLKFAKLDNSNKLLTRKCKKTEELLVHYTERLAALQGFASVIALGTIKQRAFSILSNNKLPHLQKLKPYGSENINVQGFPKDSDGKLSIPKDHSIGIIKKPNHNMLTESQKNVLIALDGLCRLESGGARDTLKLFDLVKATPAVSGIELTGLKSALSVPGRN